MKSLIGRWVDGYVDRVEYEPETIKSLKQVNFGMALQALMLSVLFWGPSSAFLRPTTPPDSIWLSLSYGNFEVWDFAFPIGTFMLLLATVTLSGMARAHLFMALCWLTLGALWIIGGWIAAPSYLFVAGIFALFIASQHASIIRAWRAEGVT